MTIQSIELGDMQASDIKEKNNSLQDAKSLSLLNDVDVSIEAKIGDALINVSQLFSLKKGDVLKLQQLVTEPVELYLNGKKIGAGELVASDENYGVRITEIAVDE